MPLALRPVVRDDIPRLVDIEFAAYQNDAQAHVLRGRDPNNFRHIARARQRYDTMLMSSSRDPEIFFLKVVDIPDGRTPRDSAGPAEVGSPSFPTWSRRYGRIFDLLNGLHLVENSQTDRSYRAESVLSCGMKCAIQAFETCLLATSLTNGPSTSPTKTNEWCKIIGLGVGRHELVSWVPPLIFTLRCWRRILLTNAGEQHPCYSINCVFWPKRSTNSYIWTPHGKAPQSVREMTVSNVGRYVSAILKPLIAYGPCTSCYHQC